jgi:hypothetical protein
MRTAVHVQHLSGYLTGFRQVLYVRDSYHRYRVECGDKPFRDTCAESL